MDLYKLKEGMIIKNYKELCGLLGVDIQTGKSKQAQLKLFQNAVKYTQNGHSFKIIEISNDLENFNNQIDIKSKRKKINYIGDIELLVMNLLSNIDNDTLIISKSKILRELYMVNHNYHECKKRTVKLSNYLNIDTLLINEWYDSTSSMLKRNLEKSLCNLENNSLIRWNKVVMVCEQIPLVPNIQPHIIIDEHDEEVVQYVINSECNSYFRISTKEERLFIMDIETEFKNALGLYNDNELVAIGQYDNMKEYVNSKLLERYNISFYYDAYEIEYIGDNVKKALDRENEIMSKNKLNKDIFERINFNIQNKISVFNRKLLMNNLDSSLLIDNGQYSRADDRYFENNKILSEKLINIESEDIVKEVKNTKEKGEEIEKYIKARI